MRISTTQMQQQAINAILDQQAQAAKTQQQLATGRRIVTPADDPVGAARVLALTQSVSVTDQYQTNINTAQSRLNLEDSTLSNVTDVLQRVRELAVQANSDTTSASARQGIAAEVQQLQQQLGTLANTTDDTGEYLFAGFKSQTQPFTTNASGAYVYNGDQGQRYVAIGPGRQVAEGDSGAEVFTRIPNGNGTFAVSANSGNTGSANIDQGSVLTNFTSATYQLSFSQASAGAPITYEVRRDPGGTNTLVASGTYSPGQAITFGGTAGAAEAQVTLNGTPANGDSFTITPSTGQDLFATVKNLADALSNPTPTSADLAQFHTTVSRAISEIDQSLNHISTVRAQVGSRLQAIASQTQINSDFKLQMQTTLSSVQDVDIASAVGRYNQQLTALQAAQQSYAKIQSLSLFNYL